MISQRELEGATMARINIEDQFFDDAAAVGAKMGSLDLAYGQALRLIRFAQTQHKAGKKITRAEFDARFSDALIPEFARPAGEFIEVAGAKHYFAWLDKKKAAGQAGGKVSALRPRDSKGRLKSSKQSPSKTKHSQASYSSSFSYSSSNSTSISKNTPPEGPGERSPAQAVIGKYCALYRDRYGERPPLIGKDSGILARLANDLGSAKVEEMLNAYFQMPDAWVVAGAHAVELFVSKRNEIQRFISTGQIVTRSQAALADKDVGAKQRWAKDERKMLSEASQAGLFENPKKIVGGQS